jgi:hypothetical protein
MVTVIAMVLLSSSWNLFRIFAFSPWCQDASDKAKAKVKRQKSSSHASMVRALDI